MRETGHGVSAEMTAPWALFEEMTEAVGVEVVGVEVVEMMLLLLAVVGI